jgi:PAS domain-containing protein
MCGSIFAPFRAGLAISYRDITPRKKVQEALGQSEELCRATFNNAAVGIAHAGLDGRWIRFNHAVCANRLFARRTQP